MARAADPRSTSTAIDELTACIQIIGRSGEAASPAKREPPASRMPPPGAENRDSAPVLSTGLSCDKRAAFTSLFMAISSKWAKKLTRHNRGSWLNSTDSSAGARPRTTHRYEPALIATDALNRCQINASIHHAQSSAHRTEPFALAASGHTHLRASSHSRICNYEGFRRLIRIEGIALVPVT